MSKLLSDNIGHIELVRIGRTSRMLRKGLGVSEIASKLKIPEATVGRYVREIEKATLNDEAN